MFPIPAGIVTAVPNTGRDGVTTPIATAIAEGQGGIVSITVAAVSFVSYLIAGFVPKAYISLPIALVLMLLTIFVLHRTLKGKAAA